MADRKITELDPVLVGIDDADIFHVIQAGTNKQATFSQIKAGVTAGEIEDLPEATSINDADLFQISQGGDGFKISFANVVSDIVKFTVRTETVAFQVAATDNGQFIRVSNAAAVNVTIPLEATASIPVGVTIALEQDGVGQITLVPEGGVDVRTPETLLSRKQYSVVTIVKVATDEWIVSGDLEAV